MKKGIGVGIEDFKKIIEEDCYYFDKTNYIEELLKDMINSFYIHFSTIYLKHIREHR